MIEVTITEMMLLVGWAVAATVSALHYRDEVNTAKGFMVEVLKNKELRDMLVAKYEQRMKEQ